MRRFTVLRTENEISFNPRGAKSCAKNKSRNDKYPDFPNQLQMQLRSLSEKGEPHARHCVHQTRYYLSSSRLLEAVS